MSNAFYFILLIASAFACALVMYHDVRSSGLNNAYPQIFEANKFFQTKDGTRRCNTRKLEIVHAVVFANMTAMIPILIMTGAGDVAFLPFLLYSAISVWRVLKNYRLNREFSGKK